MKKRTEKIAAAVIGSLVVVTFFALLASLVVMVIRMLLWALGIPL